MHPVPDVGVLCQQHAKVATLTRNYVNTVLFPSCVSTAAASVTGSVAVQMGVRSRRSRLEGGDLLDPAQRHQKARRGEEASLDASLESSGDISSTSDDEDACTDATDLSLMSEAEASRCACN